MASLRFFRAEFLRDEKFCFDKGLVQILLGSGHVFVEVDPCFALRVIADAFRTKLCPKMERLAKLALLISVRGTLRWLSDIDFRKSFGLWAEFAIG